MKIIRTISTIIYVLITGFVVFGQSLNTSPLPEPTGMVNDYANIIEDGVQAQIEQKLRDFKAKTNPSVEIAIVTVKTTGDRPIFDYSLSIARGWKIGSKDDDNPSALIVVAVDDKKYFTQISKDLEDELPDGLVGQLQRQYLVPAFKEANYTKGINETVDAFIRSIEERKSAPNGTPTPKNSTGKSGLSGGVICCIIIVIAIIIIIIIISSFFGKGGGSSRNDRDRWRSGGFGGNTSNNSVIIWGGGSSSSDWGGNSSSSDWGSSGGDSWGGFGGGGDFGGGGAGGDW